MMVEILNCCLSIVEVHYEFSFKPFVVLLIWNIILYGKTIVFFKKNVIKVVL